MSKKIYPLIFLFIICFSLIIYLFVTNNTSEIILFNFQNHFQIRKNNDLRNITEAWPSEEKFTVRFSANKLTKLKDNEKLKQWTSSAPPPLSVEVLGAADEPVYKKLNKNSPATVYFNGRSYFEIPKIVGSQIIDLENTTVVAVFKPQNFETPETIFELFSWGDCEQNRFLAHVSPARINFQFGDPEDSVKSIESEIVPGQFNILVLERRANLSNVELNNVKIGQLLRPSKFELNKAMPFFLGTSACAHNFIGEIAEFIILKNLTNGEKNSLVKKLANEYNLSFF